MAPVAVQEVQTQTTAAGVIAAVEKAKAPVEAMVATVVTVKNVMTEEE